MASPRMSNNNTTLSSSIYERRQVQARIRALQQRTSEWIRRNDLRIGFFIIKATFEVKEYSRKM